jgi:hypothetical protein
VAPIISLGQSLFQLMGSHCVPRSFIQGGLSRPAGVALKRKAMPIEIGIALASGQQCLYRPS